MKISEVQVQKLILYTTELGNAYLQNGKKNEAKEIVDFVSSIYNQQSRELIELDKEDKKLIEGIPAPPKPPETVLRKVSGKRVKYLCKGRFQCQSKVINCPHSEPHSECNKPDEYCSIKCHLYEVKE